MSDEEDIDLSKRDEYQVRLDNNLCPRCLVGLRREDKSSKKCWACGLIVLDEISIDKLK
tara:strand:- start:179 stop:355 length:177 start_codon:yes stop_codon:yes gene_type:complete